MQKSTPNSGSGDLSDFSWMPFWLRVRGIRGQYVPRCIYVKWALGEALIFRILDSSNIPKAFAEGDDTAYSASDLRF